jgi:iron complex outermembrane receptor protein
VAWIVLQSAVAVASAQAGAQTSADEEELALAYGDRATVSIATGAKQPLRRAPAVATVITADDIAAMGATNLEEALEMVAGMHVSISALGSAPRYMIRGIVSLLNPQVLLLINGAPMTALLRGDRGQFPEEVPLENVARIEVIRGPGSALYGADAFAGVINVITKSAAEARGTELGARGGSFETWHVWGQHGSTLGPVDVAAHIRVGGTDGHHRTIESDAQTVLDQLFGTNASLAPGPMNTGRGMIDAALNVGYGKWRWRAGYKRQRAETGYGVGSALDPVGRITLERITSELSWTEPQLTRDWSTGVAVEYLHFKQLVDPGLRVFPPGAAFPSPPSGTFANGMIGAPDTWERHWRFAANATYTGMLNNRLRFGTGYEDMNLYRTRERKNFSFHPSGLPVPTPNGEVIDFTDIAPFLLPHRRRLAYVYVQDEWQFAKDWALTAGVRHDRYSDVGNTTNPRFALVWDAAYNVTAKLLYGTAFRPPSFAELYSINNPVTVGNPNLDPEKIKTTEAVVAWQSRRDTELKASIFHYRTSCRRRPIRAAGPACCFRTPAVRPGAAMRSRPAGKPRAHCA